MNKPKSRNLFKEMWRTYVKKHWGKLTIAAFFMVLEATAMVVFVKSMKNLLDDVFGAQNGEGIWSITILICGVFVIRGIGSFIHRSLTVNTGVNVIGEMQQDLTRHLLTLDMNYFNRNAPGGLIERVRGDTQALQALSSTTLITLGRDSATLIGMLYTAFSIDLYWTLILFIGTPLLILPIGLLQKFIRRYSRSARHSSAELSTRLDEMFHGIKAIKLNNLYEHENNRFDETIKTFISTSLKSQYSNAAMPSIIDIIAGMGFVAVIYHGGSQIVNGDKTLGEFMTFFLAVGFMFDPIRRLTNVSGALQSAKVNLERVYSIFDQKPIDRPNATEDTLKYPTGDISFKGVEFAYADQPVLNRLTFTAPGEKTTAFVGPSGAGKSTLFNILTQLEQPDSGSITIGGQDISQLDLTGLRDQIAVVSQESALFDESIAANIAMGKLDSSDADIEQAAKTALVTDFANEQPEGLNSLAGPRGSNLSGGQRQRVIIARALLRNAPILLLDEATAALDNQTEKKIQALLDDFTHEKTTLVIAHRLTTVMNADLIHVMHEGQIVESGTHEELLKLNNHYAQLHKTLEQ